MNLNYKILIMPSSDHVNSTEPRIYNSPTNLIIIQIKLSRPSPIILRILYYTQAFNNNIICQLNLTPVDTGRLAPPQVINYGRKKNGSHQSIILQGTT